MYANLLVCSNIFIQLNLGKTIVTQSQHLNPCLLSHPHILPQVATGKIRGRDVDAVVCTIRSASVRHCWHLLGQRVEGVICCECKLD